MNKITDTGMGSGKSVSLDEMMSAVEASSGNSDVVMRFKCGWCGWPTNENGKRLVMSQIGLKKNIERNWVDAKLVNGECCANNPDQIGHAAISEDLDT